MKIIVVFTGGTIGSRVDETGYISTKSEAPYPLLAPFEEDKEISFITREPYCILSENLQAKELKLLAEEVAQDLKQAETDSEIGGIIICHGTDTLQYSAAILQYLFADSRIPILLVSSAYVLEDPRANGPANFKGAVDFIKAVKRKTQETNREKQEANRESQAANRESQEAWGVFVAYQNRGEEVTIHRGSRLSLPILYSDIVTSVSDKWVAKVTSEGEIRFRENVVQQNANTLPLGPANLLLTENTDFLCRLRVYPGMTYPKLESSGYEVVMLETYHSGTICICEQLRMFMTQAKRLGIPVYLIGLDTSITNYETVKMYDALGIQVLSGASAVAQYCKLWLLHSNGLAIETHMKKIYGQER